MLDVLLDYKRLTLDQSLSAVNFVSYIKETGNMVQCCAKSAALRDSRDFTADVP